MCDCLSYGRRFMWKGKRVKGEREVMSTLDYDCTRYTFRLGQKTSKHKSEGDAAEERKEGLAVDVYVTITKGAFLIWVLLFALLLGLVVCKVPGTSSGDFRCLLNLHEYITPSDFVPALILGAFWGLVIILNILDSCCIVVRVGKKVTVLKKGWYV